MTSRDVTPEVSCESDVTRVAELTGESATWVDGMLIHRQGDSHDSNMTAIGLHRVARSTETYQVSGRQGLVVADDPGSMLELEAAVESARHDRPPAHVTVSAVWNSAAREVDSENVLGDSVVFSVDSAATEIHLPVLEATPERLGYYGAALVEEGSLVRFPAPDYPIWKMELGERYIDGLVMTDQGTGFYLEYHRDRPHWHQPLTPDSGGYYILARALAGNGNGVADYQLTGFQIPYGKAVYTGLGAIHCDAALTGRNWLVGYSDSGDFSTALVRNTSGERIRLSGSID